MTVLLILSIGGFLLLYLGIKLSKEVKKEELVMETRLNEEIDIISHYEVNEKEIEYLKSILKSNEIVSIKLFQINEVIYDIKSKGQYIIDGGIEFILNNGCFTLGFSSEYEQFIFSSEPFNKIYTNGNDYKVEKEEMPEIFNLLNLKIEDIFFKTKDFSEITDYTMTTKQVKKIVQVVFSFENNQCLQLSLINFSFDEKQKPTNFSYSIDNEILISFEKTEIM